MTDPIESRMYRRFECVTFRKTDEEFGAYLLGPRLSAEREQRSNTDR
jgi:hypothetical protein